MGSKMVVSKMVHLEERWEWGGQVGRNSREWEEEGLSEGQIMRKNIDGAWPLVRGGRQRQ